MIALKKRFKNTMIVLRGMNKSSLINTYYLANNSMSFRYIPILMAQASIYWDMRNYAAIEKIFRKSVEFCSDHDVWRLNVGHVLFMQDNNKYRDAIGFYEPIVKKHYDHVNNQLLWLITKKTTVNLFNL